MAQVSFSEFQPEVLAVAAACPTPTIHRAVRNSLIELAERGDCFRHTLEGDLAIANLNTVEFSLPSDTSLVRPVALRMGTVKLQAYSVRMLDEDAGDRDWRAESGTPKYWLRSPGTLNGVILYPIPVENGIVKGEVSIRPSRDSTGFEEVYIDRFFSTIVDGALARLLAVPAAPWFQPDAAIYHKKLFEAQIDETKRVADADDVHKRRNIRYGGY